MGPSACRTPRTRSVDASRVKRAIDIVGASVGLILAAPLFWLLKWLHGLIGNWGWAIVVMTILIKSAFYPLNHATNEPMPLTPAGPPIFLGGQGPAPGYAAPAADRVLVSAAPVGA